MICGRPIRTLFLCTLHGVLALALRESEDAVLAITKHSDSVEAIGKKVLTAEVVAIFTDTKPVYTVLGVCILLLSAPFVWWTKKVALGREDKAALKRSVEHFIADAEGGDMRGAKKHREKPDPDSDAESEDSNAHIITAWQGGGDATDASAQKGCAVTTGSLVYICAHTELPDPVLDHDIGVSFYNCLEAYRVVKVYQWVETRDSETGMLKLEKRWVRTPVNTKRFVATAPDGTKVRNTCRMWIDIGGSKELRGSPMRIRNVELPRWMIKETEGVRRVGDLPVLKSSVVDILKSKIGMDIRLHPNGFFYTTEPDPSTGMTARIGDLRISYFKRAGSGVVSVLGAITPHRKHPGTYRLSEYSLRGSSLFPVCINRRLARVTWIKAGKVPVETIIAENIPRRGSASLWIVRALIMTLYAGSADLIIEGTFADMGDSAPLKKLAQVWMPLAVVVLALIFAGISLSFAHMFTNWVRCTALILAFVVIAITLCVAW